MRITNGYLVSRDAGYRIISGVAEAGSLVVKNGQVLGIITQRGMD